MGGSDSTLFCRSLDCHKSRTGGGCHRAAQYTPFILPLTAAACSAICPRLYGIAAGLAVLVLFYCASLCNMSIMLRFIHWKIQAKTRPFSYFRLYFYISLLKLHDCSRKI